MNPQSLLPAGTRVRHSHVKRLIGEIIGHGVISPCRWTSTTQPVYLVALDEGIQWPDTDNVSLSVVTVNVGNVQTRCPRCEGEGKFPDHMNFLNPLFPPPLIPCKACEGEGWA